MSTALLDAMLPALFFFLGLVVGSFLNVCIDRLPAGKSIINPPSACDNCHHRLGIRDLIPVLSFLWLRGRCRHCRSPITRRLPVVELAMGAGFPLLYWYYGLTPALSISLVYLCLLTIIFVIDIEHQLILDRVVFPGMALALVFSLFSTEMHAEISWRPIYAAIGGGAGFTLMLIPFLVSRGGMGFGDVKMAALIGLIAGFPGILIALFLAIISGGLAATALLILRRKKRREAVPFGPFLAAGAMLVIVWGGEIQLWYQQFIA